MELYKAYIRNGWHLPRFGTFITFEYLTGVRFGKFWAPRFDDVKLRGCPDEPSKEEVLHEVLAALKEKCLPSLSGDLNKKVPEKKWLLACLSTLNPSHRFFAKGYMPPPRPKK